MFRSNGNGTTKWEAIANRDPRLVVGYLHRLRKPDCVDRARSNKWI